MLSLSSHLLGFVPSKLREEKFLLVYVTVASNTIKMLCDFSVDGVFNSHCTLFHLFQFQLTDRLTACDKKALLNNGLMPALRR